MSIRTVIDFSPLSETTMPWRTLAALASRSAAGVPAPAAPRSAFAAVRCLRRSSAFALRVSARLAARSSGLSWGPASCGRLDLASRRRSFHGSSSSGFSSGSCGPPAGPHPRGLGLLLGRGLRLSAGASSASSASLVAEESDCDSSSLGLSASP